MRIALMIAFTACSVDPTPAAPPTPKQPPGFIYLEDGDELTFWPPTSLRLVRGKTICSSELSADGHGNMWTGRDVEAALANPDVQAVLSRGGTAGFIPATDMDNTIHVGSVRIGKSTIEWRTACRGCTAEPAGVRHLHTVLVGVMRNRRAMCPTKT